MSQKGPSWSSMKEPEEELEEEHRTEPCRTAQRNAKEGR